MQAIKNAQTADTSAQNVFKNAFEATATQRAELFPDDLMPINIDVRQAHNTALGVLPKLKVLREQVGRLPDFDVAQFDAIETYAQALAYAHPMYLGAAPHADELPELATHAMTLRDRLVGDATMLGRRNLVDAKRLAQVQGGTGYLNVASDLATVVGVLRDSWAAVKGKCPIEESELDAADELYRRMTMASASRAQASEKAAAWGDERQRAYTLLVKAYDQARRAALYLRWAQDDADSVVPSLWKGRGARPGTKEPVVTPPVDGDEPTVPQGDQPVVPTGDSPVVPVNA